MIPANLPPTTAPCPHCSGVITSPDLNAPVAPLAALQTPPPLPIETRIVPTVPTAQKAEESAAEEKLPVPIPGPHKLIPTANKPERSGLIRTMLILLALFLLGLGVVYYIASKMSQNTAPPVTQATSSDPKTDDANYIRIGWQKDAYQLLRGYIAATRDKDKAQFILNGSELATQLTAFYASGLIDDSDTPADAFSIYELSEEDRKRGLFLMVYDQPPQLKTKKLLRTPASLEAQNHHNEADLAQAKGNLAMESRRIYAFFKRTPEGLKLDWEIFVQTKYRTLQTFLGQPKIGESKVFRVFIVEDTPEKSLAATGTRTYRVADPANTSDIACINVKEDSEIGRTLSNINWRGTEENRPIIHTATLELKWGGKPTAPALEINRFVCWEFLGLGSNQTPAPTLTN